MIKVSATIVENCGTQPDSVNTLLRYLVISHWSLVIGLCIHSYDFLL
ncbi:hypothetical protein NSP_9880 [Nodularia spumigena CCY9414]|nr:hypothetical protein NSP_9880 [Nodularia spumigena CCY9414]